MLLGVAGSGNGCGETISLATVALRAVQSDFPAQASHHLWEAAGQVNQICHGPCYTVRATQHVYRTVILPDFFAHYSVREKRLMHAMEIKAS